MKLNEIGLPEGRKSRKTRRRGRGDASGRGSTAGKGHKGQKARAGGYHKTGFEGGQMPLQRRVPKRGFTNIFRKDIAAINVADLANFDSGFEINMAVLKELGLVRRSAEGVKILGKGEVSKSLTVKVNAISASARTKIEAAGGKVEVIGG